MAAKKTDGRKQTTTRAKKCTNTNRSVADKKRQAEMMARKKANDSIRDEVILIITFVFSVLIILSYFTLCGRVGEVLNNFLFGMIGTFTYLFPFALFFGVAFSLSNRGSVLAKRKVLGSIVLIFALTALIQMISGYKSSWSFFQYYTECRKSKSGGGLIGAVLALPLNYLFGSIAAVLILIAIILLCIIFISGKAILSLISKKGEEKFHHYREQRAMYAEEYEQLELDDEAYQEPKKKARVVTLGKPSKDQKAAKEEDDLSELISVDEEENISFLEELKRKGRSKATDLNDVEIQEIPISRGGMEHVELEEIKPEEEMNFGPSEQMINEVNSIYEQELNKKFGTDEPVVESAAWEQTANATESISVDEHPFYDSESGFGPSSHTEEIMESTGEIINTDTGEVHSIEANEVVAPKASNEETNPAAPKAVSTKSASGEEILTINQTVEEVKKYEFPPIKLLGLPKGNQKGMSDKDLKETANKLKSTLESFGVRVTITNVSCGPAVTRYELQPEQGVKVSKITGLADDIKLNLAAADVRIEAPIPGKAAVGIEVPNKENTAVMLRELLDAKEFKNHPSDIAFAVGKDIGGQAVVTDIAKMPHLLIAGATGSGKSVCINTLIMSILYKANPADVRLIMVDPKVVELSVYNGIPHLLIPVVTDPKKASAALNWAVMEMTDRYKKFAELGVRDLKGYNERVKEVEHLNDPAYQKLPQIVIIVDELADLMMVAPGEVEDAICRLAQMARAAGLHLIIATQRPSVNVITGLIKANVPSRIAFSVSSAVDSRTIIDSSGAEKLLGKGDMLFFPSGYPKPVRVQGAFVSDKEVSAVVDFLKAQNTDHTYSDEISNKIASAQTSSASGGASSPDRDDYFVEAGKFIIDKDKASIGMLQRVYKIGFNRAARIMEQLADAGVVGPEEGTKPRKILMSLEEFEAYVDEYV
ncbi:MAG: DNA translocase FtsK [Clostridiales bacterium]|nr:DNA translocase FtsK [Clostridiales bacterium]